jgi:uncharacterized RDD family membrane protein YckC
MIPNAEGSLTPAPRYARFSRRLRGIMLDWIITLIVIFGAVLVAATVGSDNVSRALGILVVMALLLYEPVLVSFTGGTLGHYFSNLRVVDERSGGNVSFLKACARIVIKGVLGWYSFIVMTATRRNQAVHDLLTRSTVQIRDPAKASPYQYITERSEFSHASMPSRWRRLAVICSYLLLIFVIYLGVLAGIIAMGGLSPRCVDNNYCSPGERLASIAVSLMPLAASALCIALGWRGKLFGARKTDPGAADA